MLGLKISLGPDIQSFELFTISKHYSGCCKYSSLIVSMKLLWAREKMGAGMADRI